MASEDIHPRTVACKEVEGKAMREMRPRKQEVLRGLRPNLLNSNKGAFSTPYPYLSHLAATELASEARLYGCSCIFPPAARTIYSSPSASECREVL